MLTEESYLKAYPEERKSRAFLQFCGDGDVEAIVDLLRDYDEDEDDVISAHGGDALRYQDHIGSLDSGLHVAVQNQRIEVAWLLLFLASTLEITEFPAEVLQAAERFGLSREETGKTDIRSLKDAHGRTPEQRAREVGGVWTQWVQVGILRPPGT